MAKKEKVARNVLKGCAIAEIPLKIVLTGLFAAFGIIVILVGAVVTGVGAGLGAAIGGAVGGSEGASQAANNVEMPVAFTVLMYVFEGLALLSITVGLPLACTTLKRVKKAQSKKELKSLSIANLFFFNIIIGIAVLVAKEYDFLTPEQIKEAQVKAEEPVVESVDAEVVE